MSDENTGKPSAQAQAEAKAYESGRMSIINFDADAKNPYPFESPFHEQWNRGREDEENIHQKD